jgi:bla regulator protein BlaR1
MLTPESAALFARLAANHLWQSTAFAAVVVALALALRGNHARVRHRLWLAASVKFLIPFSVLASLGGSLGRWLAPVAPISRLPLVMEQIVRPFAPIPDGRLPVGPVVQAPAAPGVLPYLFLALWLCGFVAVSLYGWVHWRRIAATVRASSNITEGRELEALRRIRWSSGPLRLVSSIARLEPGTFGILRPVIWLPAGIADHLNDAELEAILAHELCHIRRRDSLTAVIQMTVEAIFWFHPLIWWLTSRLTEERERACDEEVVKMGGAPQVYAESILKVCEFYLASPAAFAPGVTGGELKKRIERIMTNRFARDLSFGRKLLLASAAVAVVAGPFAFGIASAGAQTASPEVNRSAPRFDVVSVKAAPSETGGAWDTFPVNGTWSCKAMTIQSMVAYAYSVSSNRVEGIPKALQGPDAGFSIVAKMPLKTSHRDFFLMLQSLLTDRVKAVIHTEVRDVPVNTIEVAKGGVKLRPASGQCVEAQGNAAVPVGQQRCHQVESRVGIAKDRTITWDYYGRSVSLAELARGLSKVSSAGQMDDDTGLSGLYDFDVKIETHPGQDEFDNQSIWRHDWREAWEKQAGLLMDLSKTKKRPGTVVVVDHVEFPTAN